MKSVMDVMTKDVETIGPNDTLKAAAEKMRELSVGPLPVCEGDKLMGIITDRDIVVRAIAEDLPPKSTPLSAVTSHELIMVEQSATVDEVVQAMRERAVRRLLVCDADRKVVGILSLSDVALLPTSAAA